MTFILLMYNVVNANFLYFWPPAPQFIESIRLYLRCPALDPAKHLRFKNLIVNETAGTVYLLVVTVASMTVTRYLYRRYLLYIHRYTYSTVGISLEHGCQAPPRISDVSQKVGQTKLGLKGL